MSRRYWPAVVAFLLAFSLWLLFVRPASGYIDEETVLVGVVDEGTVVPGSTAVPGPWNGHDFVMVVNADNGYLINAGSLAAFFADSLGGTMDINISKVYADSAATVAGATDFLTASSLSGFWADGHGISPQGIYKPHESGGTQPENTGTLWYKGYASHADEDSIRDDVDRDWLATHLGVDASLIKALSYPYGYMNGTVYQIAQDEGYSWGRTSRQADWAFLDVDEGWPTGHADPPKILLPSLEDTDVINIYAIGGRDSSDYCYGEGDSLTYAQVIARFEETMVQPAIADGTYYLNLGIHNEPHLDRVKHILNYVNETYDVWFTDFSTLMEWWAPRNALYPRNPPSDAKGSLLVGTVAADSVFWSKTPEPTITNGYVFSNSTTAALDTLDVGGHTFPSTTCLAMGVIASSPTSVYGDQYATFTTAYWPLNDSDRMAANYFGCAATLAGKTIARAELHWYTDYLPSHENPAVFGPPDDNGRKYLSITAVTDPAFARWTNYGNAAASYTNMDQANGIAWDPALNSYAQPESLGICSYQYGTWETGNWYTTDVTHGVQAWADGEAEGGFMFTGRSFGANKFFSVRSSSHNTTATRPYLVVYTED